MSGAFALRTSPTLLRRLQRDPTDQAAWCDFVNRYGPLLLSWCRQWRLQEADAQDVTQNVLVRLAEKMRDFAYDPNQSFRAWLKTVTHHALSDFVEGRRRPGLGSGDSKMVERLHSIAAREELVSRLKDQFDQELLDEALFRVRQRIAPQRWEAFRLRAMERLPGATVAERLGMTVANVYRVQSKVQAMLKQELLRLEGPGNGAARDEP